MHEMKAAVFCINPLSNQAVRLDSGADLCSILDNLRDNGVSIERRRMIVASLALVWVFNRIRYNKRAVMIAKCKLHIYHPRIWR